MVSGIMGKGGEENEYVDEEGYREVLTATGMGREEREGNAYSKMLFINAGQSLIDAAIYR